MYSIVNRQYTTAAVGIRRLYVQLDELNTTDDERTADVNGVTNGSQSTHSQSLDHTPTPLPHGFRANEIQK